MRYLDNLPKAGNLKSGHAYRDLEWEKIILDLTREMGVGAQFGGKYFCHDVRVISFQGMVHHCQLELGFLVQPIDKF